MVDRLRVGSGGHRSPGPGPHRRGRAVAMMNTWRLGRWIGAVCWVCASAMVCADPGMPMWAKAGAMALAGCIALALVRP